MTEKEAWNAPRGIDGAIRWDNGNTSELHYARFVNGEERKAECIELDGVKYVPERTCEPSIEPWEQDTTKFDAYCGNCGWEIQDQFFRLPNYCPKCGAKVVG